MPMFGNYLPGGMRLPSPVTPVDVRELEAAALARGPRPGEGVPVSKQIENKALEDLLKNRPQFSARRTFEGFPAEAPRQLPPQLPQRAARTPDQLPQRGGDGQGITWADRLMMAGAALQGRPDLVMQYRQSLLDRQEQAQRKAAAAEFGDRFAQAYGGPRRGYPIAQLALGGLPAVEAQRDRWRQEDQQTAQAGVAQRFSDAYGGGEGGDPLQAILPDLLRLQAMGVDVSNYARLADTLEARGRRSAYINSLPPEARAEAELDPSGYAGWERERRTPSFHAVGPGTSIVGVNRATGQASPLFSNPRPTEPLSTDQLVAGVLGKAQGGAELNPTEQSILNRYLFGTDNTNDRPSPNSVVGGILDKFTRGETLSPQEEEIRGRYMTGTLSMTDQLVQQMLPQMGGLPEAGAGAPPAMPPPRVPQKGAAGGSRDNPARPKSRAEAEALPPGTWFVDPKGNLLRKG